ncbi:MAG: glycosyltransferase, partial [Bacteroidota bacterium]
MPGGVTKRKDGVHIPSLYQLVERLSEHFDITVYSLTTFEPLATESSCGNARVKILRAHYRDRWSKKLLRYISSVYVDHRKERYELLHGMLGLNAELATRVLGKLLKVPTIVSLLGGETAKLPAINYGTLAHPLLNIPMRWVCKNVSCLTVQTNFQMKQLEQHGMHREEIHIIPRGVDTSKFFPNGRTPEVAPPFRFLHVANLLDVKDQVTLLKAFKVISQSVDCRLRIIGTDYLNGKIQSLSRELGIASKVEFLEWLDHSSLREHYLWAHVLLHTSLHESLGMVVAEAAACGTVVCGTRVGLVHDLADNRVVAVEPGDYQSLAQKVVWLTQNRNAYFSLRENALRWARHHN